MVDVVASETFETNTGPSSSEQSGAERQQEVPQSVLANELLSVVESILPPTQDSTYAAFSDERHDLDPSDSDIYRGEQHPSVVPPAEDAASVASSSSSSSSSSSTSLNVGRRLGALASVVEAAISRWARTHSSSSSTTSSSSSSSVSSTTRTHTTRKPRGRRYSNSASVHNAAHERAFLALKRAQEEFRVVPREFTLLLPSNSDPDQDQDATSTMLSDEEKERRIFRTASLPLILSRLDSALKKSARAKRTANKGKGKGTTSRQAASKNATLPASHARGSMFPKCWWLDVASPTWDDLRSIGKLLHLHPLTLEDILHRDPREKLELFPRLGYYFIVFRALEGERSRERFRQFKMKSGDGSVTLPSGPADEGVIGAVNVYIVVFSEGICSFHFEDISEHTDKLRGRILQMQNSFNMSSDWIAHGIMDSIVDSFFPILSSIDKEIKEVDSLVLDEPRQSTVSANNSNAHAVDMSELSIDDDEKRSSDHLNISPDEKRLGTIRKTSYWYMNIRVPEPLFLLRRIKCFILKIVKRRRVNQNDESTESMTDTLKTLLRIAAMRRIVTSLGRLLGTKGEVIAQIRKRLILASVGTNSVNLGLGAVLDGEVAIYMGDIQDHIATLQQALNHYERMLSHSHPAYLSQLRVTQALARGGTDNAILLLTLVSITVLSMQVILGMFSMNVHVPNTEGSTDHPFSVFFSVLAGTLLIGTTVVLLVRYWHAQAKKKYSRKF
ncbi:hypothetical protein ACEPAF_3485 [Sanghuangporus sanghuang]